MKRKLYKKWQGGYIDVSTIQMPTVRQIPLYFLFSYITILAPE